MLMKLAIGFGDVLCRVAPPILLPTQLRKVEEIRIMCID